MQKKSSIENLFDFINGLKQFTFSGYGTEAEEMIESLKKMADAAINESFENGKESGCRLLETGSPHDIPGDGYFVHLLNKRWVDYNVLDSIVMSILLGSLGFVIFVLTKM